jgi:acetylornithine deacetylase
MNSERIEDPENAKFSDYMGQSGSRNLFTTRTKSHRDEYFQHFSVTLWLCGSVVNLFSFSPLLSSMRMDIVALTRQLVDIESITGNEGPVEHFLEQELRKLGYNSRLMPVEGERANVYATSPQGPSPAIIFSTHLDTVPPFIPSSEDDQKIYGRGSCDAKGIIAAQIAAAERLKEQGIYVGLLFLVGEERDSAGAKVANQQANGCKFLINGEPTENRIAIASKGSLRVQLTAAGRMAHSAYPELGDSAINKLIEALHRLQQMKLPSDPEIGPCTVNIGVIEGGRAPNVIADHARAQLLYRLVGPAKNLRNEIVAIAGDLAQVEFTLEIPAVRLRTFEGLPTMVAAFTTDIPALSNWGQPMLIGPGSIHVAHTEGEYVEKKQLHEAVELYCDVARKLAS